MIIAISLLMQVPVVIFNTFVVLIQVWNVTVIVHQVTGDLSVTTNVNVLIKVHVTRLTGAVSVRQGGQEMTAANVRQNSVTNV